MRLNLVGAVNASYCALKHMRVQGGGRVISIGSRGGFRGEREAPAYAASKMALVGFTRSLARAGAREGILAYCIAPGWVDTDMSRPRMEPRMAQIEAEIPAGRIALPSDVAGVALFLASDAANYLTGVTIDVNGGSYFR
jgi:NAD(P)-dependent dehydrogenase (short-subunit alcohol dehydrogenase family)